jgi:hypothetical protein
VFFALATGTLVAKPAAMLVSPRKIAFTRGSAARSATTNIGPRRAEKRTAARATTVTEEKPCAKKSK